MDPRLLDYYNQELIRLRDTAGEFARAHPGIARRLCLQPDEIADPYVERIVESFCFLAARLRIKLDSEFPRFATQLLDLFYPNCVAPVPSMAVARIFPCRDGNALRNGVKLPRGSIFTARVPDGEQTACRFRSGRELTLYPLEIVGARLTGFPSDLQLPDLPTTTHGQVRAALRLRLRTTADIDLTDLRGLDTLPVYLAGDEHVASHLFELLHTSAVATLIAQPGESGRAMQAVSAEAISLDSVNADQRLLTPIHSNCVGQSLLSEYFACPSCFYSFTLNGLEAGLRQINGKQADIVVLLDRKAGALVDRIDTSDFALFCTPVINLFRQQTDQIRISPSDSEFHVVPARRHPLDYEVFAVERVTGRTASGSETVAFRSLYETLNSDPGNYGRYFSQRREHRLISDSVRQYGERNAYRGTETFVSLVDQHHAPYAANLCYLSVDAWLTNRDLPTLVPRNGIDDLSASDFATIGSIGLIRAPSTPKAPHPEAERAARLIRLLNFNYLPHTQLDPHAEAQTLRDWLSLFLREGDEAPRQQIGSLVGMHLQSVIQRLPGRGPLVFGHGTTCSLTVDEAGFSGTSPYLFGTILERVFALRASLNVCTQTELISVSRGCIARWPARIVERGPCR
ncbi:type VI secretion system baseplate subunit TssF [Paraburkholderia sp. BCC1886]|uniref:type VI secretion system baseplate subunit TssF n=1 Tax=Paraburkholderia sp. BCC1886 TaxID=2562670 RepID=UPI001183F514|nr:type VI secretion system baseplate subunit TssF [Paraburkholderia sp. BCC1886]